MTDDSPFTLSAFDGVDLVAVMEVYSDASEIGGHFSIGSLLFRKKNIKPFEKKWRAMLRKYGLDYFHMTDCNAQPPRGPHQHQTEEQADACAREAIGIILDFAAKGAIFSVKVSDFYDEMGESGVMPNPFTLGAWFTLFDLRHWADEHDPIARISYIFEAGDDHQKDANALFRSVRDNPKRREGFRYRNHAFLPKEDTYPAQAADILAWHGAKHRHRRERDKEKFRLRGDFNAIITKLEVTDGHHERAWLKRIVEIADKEMLGREIVGLAFRTHSENSHEVAKRVAEILAGDPDAAAKFMARAKLAVSRSD